MKIDKTIARVFFTEYCKTHKLHQSKLISLSRSREILQARRALIKEMRDKGFSYGQIAAVMNRGRSTIQHYLKNN